VAKEIISFNYTLTDKDKKVIDASQPGHPLIFMTESGQIIPGLESFLIQLGANEKKTITVPAKEAYGVYNQTMVYKVNKSKLPVPQPKMGDVFEAGNGQNKFPVTVIHVENDEITLDGNHPLAGQDLTFEVEVVLKRMATVEEVAHGHAHSADGCHH
jgi:FKBP-type peptidyl-prolyl cis-trans isomerase SlyD